MTLKVKSGGSWIEPTTVKAKDGGTWKQVRRVWAKLSGAWSVVWSYVTVAISNDSDSDYLLGASGTVTAGFRFTVSSGVVTLSDSVLQYFAIDPTSETSNYQIRFTILSGSPSGTFGIWLDLGSVNREFSISRSTFGTTTASVRAEIRNKNDLYLEDTADYSLSVTKEDPS